jgi:hypothetical protein
LAGDAVCDRRYHGGLDQAVYVEGIISLDRWTDELGRSLQRGEFGENLVVEDLDNETVAVGDRLLIGDVCLEVTAPRMREYAKKRRRCPIEGLTITALWNAVGPIVELFTPTECANYFKAAGYEPD